MGITSSFFNKMINSALFKSAGIYTLTNIINAAIPFLLMPVLTRYLNPVDYGITAMLQVLIGFITPFVGVNVHGAVSVKYFKRDQIDFPKYVSSCLMILMLTSLLMSVIVCIFQDQISSISQFPVDWLWTILLICFSQFTISILLAILQSDVQPKTYGIVQVLQTTMNLSLTIWLVVIHGFNWQGRVIAQTATVVCFAVFSIIFLYRRGWLVRGYDKAYIKDALNFGVPLIPHSIAGILMVMADRIIITQIVGVIDTGIYTVGAQIGMVIGLLETSVNQAYVPWLYDKLSKITDNAKHQIVQFTYSFAAIIFFIAITFSLIMPYFLKYFVGKEFYGASNVIIWVAIGYAFNGMYKMTGIYFCYIEKTKILSYITFLTALIHIIITYYAVKIFGAIGAGYAITITYLLKWLLTWYISARMYPMPWCESIFKVFK